MTAVATEPTTAVTIPLPIAVPGISQAQYDAQEVFRQQLQDNMPQIMAALPPGVRATALASMAMTAALDNPKLLECEPVSLMRATLKVGTLGLRIGETCDIVPIGKKAECWIRVKGVVELAIRSGAIQWAREGFVCQGDDFGHEETENGTKFRHRALVSPKLDGSNVTHVFAIVILASGQRVYEVWPMERVLAHKAKNVRNTGPKEPWQVHPLPMMAKTVVKAALRFAPLSPEIRRVMSDGDNIGDATFEVVPDDPTAALAQASGALDALARLSSGTTSAEPTGATLADAEAVLVPGDSNAWGGKGGQTLGAQKPSFLLRVRTWAAMDDEKRAKFAYLIAACEIILADRTDRDESQRTEAAMDDGNGDG